MKGNPFYVHPGTDFGAQLTGLGQTISEVGEQKRKREVATRAKAKLEEAKAAATEAYASGDPDKIAEVNIMYPEVGATLSAQVKFKNESTRANYTDSLFRAIEDPSQVANIVTTRQAFLKGQGADDTADTDSFLMRYNRDPEGTMRAMKVEAAILDPEKFKAYTAATEKSYKGLGSGYETYLRANKLDNTPENYKKFTMAEGAAKEYAPSPLKKLIKERQEYIDAGMAPEHPTVRAYDAKISGTDIDIEEMTKDEVDTWGTYLNMTGKMPSLGRGKQSTKMRMQIVKSAARQALGADGDGVPDEPDKTPSQAALDMLGEQSDTKAIQGSLNFLDKQLSSMGSFVTNLNSQVDKVKELSKDLKTYDTRLLNTPLRALRGRIAGSPIQAKYDMYLTEIEAEIGKLATGATGSVAELSQGAQEKWAKIHDKSLSVKDMMSLLEETKEAANFRVQSVRDELAKTRKRMRRVDDVATAREESGEEAIMNVTTQAEFDLLPSGTIYLEDGKQYRKP